MSRLWAWTLGGQNLEFETHDTALSLWWQQQLALGAWKVDSNLCLSQAQETLRELTELTGLDPSQLDRAGLNDLHWQFEQQHSLRGEDPYWSRINLLIHRYENELQEKERYLAVSQHREQRQPIPPEWRPLWKHRAVTGDLTMGYHTVGKSLTACYYDRDGDILAKGAVSPQWDLHSQALLTLARPDHGQRSDPLWNERLDNLIQSWARQQNPTQDLTGIEHRYHGRPLLARVKDPSDMQAFCLALLNGDSFDRWELD